MQSALHWKQRIEICGNTKERRLLKFGLLVQSFQREVPSCDSQCIVPMKFIYLGGWWWWIDCFFNLIGQFCFLEWLSKRELSGNLPPFFGWGGESFTATAYIKRGLGLSSIVQKHVTKDLQATFHFCYLINSNLILVEFI